MFPKKCSWLVLVAIYHHVNWCLVVNGHQGNTCSICTCNNITNLVNCSSTNLSAIPEDPTGETETLIMTATRLYTLNQSSFNTYHNLRVLDLFNTSLTNISEDTFQNMNTLTHLDLSANDQLPFIQSTTPTNIFRGLESLTVLRIYGTTGTYHRGQYPAEALLQLPNLQELWLDGNDDRNFGIEFQKMTSLKKIVMPGDRIQPPWRFCNIANLTEDMVSNLTHVTHLSIRMCGIKNLNGNTFSKMKNLEYLDLSLNKHLTVKGAWEGFSGLGNTKLEVLVLNSVENPFTLRCGIVITRKMSKATQVLKFLKDLHLERNAIEGFESGALEEFTKSIERIYARRNEFELGFYNFEAFHLQNLKHFDISYNFFIDDSAIFHNGNQMVLADEDENMCKDVAKSDMEIADAHTTHNVGFSNDMSYRSLDLSSFVSNIKLLGGNLDMVNHFTKFLERDRLFRAGQLHHHGPKGDHSVCPNRTGFPAEAIVINLPPSLENIDISFSQLAHPISELYFNETNSIKMVNVSNAPTYCWDGPLHGVGKHLEYVDLSFNYCTDVRLTFFDSAPNLKFLSIGFNLLFINIQSDTTGRLLRNLTKLETLHMQYNRIEEIPRKFLTGQRNLKILNVSCNLLSEFEIDMLHMKHIEMIDLHSNHISTLSKEMRDDLDTVAARGRLFIDMANNPIQCYCNNVDFLHWVYGHMSCRFLNINITHCVYYNQTEVRVHNMEDLDKIIRHLEKYCASYTNLIIGITVAMFFVINIIVGVIVHRFRWKIRYWYYVASKNIKTRRGYISMDSLRFSGSRFKYDVYIVSVDETKEFVLEVMKQKLEEHNFKLFIQSEDILPGLNSYSVITNGIHVSRVVVFVISASCEHDHEWKIAMHMAREESLIRCEPVFFGVLKGVNNVELRKFSSDIDEIMRRSCIDYTEQQTFWDEFIEKIERSNENQIISLN